MEGPPDSPARPSGGSISNITSSASSKGKGKVLPITGHEGPEGRRYIALLFLQPQNIDRGGWSAPPLGRFTPGEEPVPIV